MLNEEDKIYFLPGQVVRIKQGIQNRPDMIVIGKVTNVFKRNVDKGNSLKGIKCIWFNTQQELQEGVFSTKDLELVK